MGYFKRSKSPGSAVATLKPTGAFKTTPKFRRGGQPKGYFLGGMFGGSGGGSSTSSSSNSTTTMNYDPAYTDLMHKVMGQGSSLMDTPYTPYTAQRFEPFTADQNAGFQGVRDMQGAWRPYTEDASAAYGRAGNTDAFASGNPYVQQAAGMQNGSQAAQPYFSQASQNWPGAVDQYMNPYMGQVTDRIAQLGNRNLMENILPGVNDAFTRDGGASFGRDRHADFTQRAIRDTQDSILGTQANALSQGYQQGAQNFQADQNRQAQLGTSAGAMANADIGTRAGLGTTAGNLAATSKAGDVGLGQAQAGLGQTVQGSGMRDAQALATSGQIQQQQGQQQQDFNYQQFMNQMNWPFQMAQFGQQIGQGWQLPYTQNTQSQSQSNTQQQMPEGSPFGNILGGLTGIGGLGASSGQSPMQGIGNILRTMGSFMGFEEGGSVPRGHFAKGGHARSRDYALGGIVNSLLGLFGVDEGTRNGIGQGVDVAEQVIPFFLKRGGQPEYAAGGHAAVVKGIRGGVQKRRGAFAHNGPPMMPSPGGMPMPAMGGPGMPSPMAGPPPVARKRGGHFKQRYADGGSIEMPSDWLLRKAWESLPREARDSYSSLGDVGKWLATEMNPAAAVRDMVKGSGETGRGFFNGDSSQVIDGVTDMASGALGLVPGWGLVPRAERALLRAVR